MRELFVSYKVDQLKKAMAAHPDAFHYFESVEPSDEYGDCQCEECRRMGNNSTRVFVLANDVAKAYRAISPSAYVNLLAYNTHADTPSVRVEANVIVQLAPYKYQHVMSAEGLIEAWQKKSDTLFMYDYFGLPLLNVDMPLIGPLRPWSYMSRVKYWYKHGVKGALLESSNSIGAAGLGLYLFSRLGWNINDSVAQLMDEYYNLNYGKAGHAMYVAQNHLVNTLDNKRGLYESMAVIATRVNKRGLKPEELRRITEYKSYLHYLKLLYDYKGADKQYEIQATDTLIRYAHGIFMRMMISQFPLIEHMWTYGPTAGYIHKYWDEYNPSAKDSKYPTVVQWTDAQIDAAFDEDYRQIREALPPQERTVPKE